MSKNEPESSSPLPAFATDARDALRDLSKFVSSVWLGFAFLTEFGPKRAKLSQHADPKIRERAAKFNEVQQYEDFAANEFSNEGPYVYLIATTRLTTIVEAAVSDACLELLTTLPASWKRDAIQRLQGPLVEFAAAGEAERAEYIFDTLTQETKSKLKQGVGKFEVLLDAVGLGGGVDDDARRWILEMIEVRNAIVHRNGRIDAKFAKSCPWMLLRRGERLTVTEPMFSRYLLATEYYMTELLRRWSVTTGATPATVSQHEMARDVLLVRLRSLP